MMAWVNLAQLPSQAGHFFYVEGESESGNDLDVQFETDNVLRFYTAAGGNLAYTPPSAALIGQWHMIVVTLDTPTHTRVIYWDGKPVSTDKGGGEAGKKSVFSIGASTVFGGRFFNGEVEEAAIWSRALAASEVSAIYAAKGKAATAPPKPGTPAKDAGNGSGQFPFNAKVEVKDGSGSVPLKRPEQVAIMFLTAIQNIELNCQLSAKHACTLDQLLTGPVAENGTHLAHLKYDPRTDSDYTYTLGANGMAWEAHANAKRPGLAGFCFLSQSLAQVTATYNPSGTSGAIDKELTERSVDGDSFATQ
jgi:Concanavalin A-like lectin/glucanases superfamily